MSVLASEREKYQSVWEFPAYAAHSPGVAAIDRFLSLTEAKAPASVLDLGCGAGAASVELSRRGFDVSLVDMVDVRSEDAKALRWFTEQPLWTEPRYHSADFGFCVDVLEHIPTEFVLLAIEHMRRSVGKLYLEVCMVPDQFGVLVGEPLHQTVKPFTWWRDRLLELDPRMRIGVDLLDRAAFVLS